MDNLVSQDAERAVLGAILIDSSVLPLVRAKISPEHYCSSLNSLIYSEICRIDDLNQEIDPITVSNHPEIDLSYVAEISDTLGSINNTESYADIILEKYKARKLYNASIEIAKIVADGNSVDESLQKAQTLLDSVNTGKEAIVDTAKDAAKKLMEVLEERIESEGRLTGVASGLEKVDERIMGYKPGNLIIISGRPGTGKTTFALNIAEHEAVVSRGSSLIFSLEMTSAELIEKFVSSIGSVNMSDLKTGQALCDEVTSSSLIAAVATIKDSKINICDKGGITLNEVRAIALGIKRKEGLSLVVIDYIQLMGGEGYNRENEISKISRGLKSLAKELNVPVIALSQLSRKCEERPNKRPMNSDLRESGSLEQDADIIQHLYRDEMYYPESQYKGISEIITGKFRGGEVGTDYVNWQGRFSRFKDLNYNDLPQEEFTSSKGFRG